MYAAVRPSRERLKKLDTISIVPTAKGILWFAFSVYNTRLLFLSWTPTHQSAKSIIPKIFFFLDARNNLFISQLYFPWLYEWKISSKLFFYSKDHCKFCCHRLWFRQIRPSSFGLNAGWMLSYTAELTQMATDFYYSVHYNT
jgi:hypothetical protein